MGFTWLAIGDSITYGKSAINDNGYINLTRKALKESGKNHFLTNQGVPSITSTQYLRRFKSNIRTVNADVITIMLGTNDSSLTPVQYNSNITQLIDLIRQNAVGVAPKIILLTVLYRNDSNDGLMVQFNSELSSIATSKKVDIVDTRSAFSTSSFLADLVHPNDAGHQKIAEVLVPRFLQILS